MPKTLWIACLLVLPLAAAGDDLPRHGVIGLAVGGTPVAVQSVIADGAGAAAGFEPGDVIEALDGRPIGRPDEFSRAIGRHLAGETVQVTVRHSGEKLVRTAVLKPKLYETDPDADVLYRSVIVRGARRRVIVTRPHRPGRLPAVLIMQGLGCYSVDNAGRRDGYGRIIGALEKKGFATMRVEKTGEGDSEGPSCTDLSATPDLEAEGWVAGLRALKSYDFVDPAKVFVFAHSMGPVVGSLAIAEEPVRGFIAVETVGTSWFEYDIERSRLQHGLTGGSPEEVDRAVREYTACSYRFFMEKQRPEELLKIPACESVLAPFGPVPYTYMQAVADISLGRQWRGADFPVLVVYGTASPVTTARQNRYLAEIVNRYHPGRATYVEVPGMGHDFNHYASQADYMARSASGGDGFDADLLDVVLPWLEKVG